MTVIPAAPSLAEITTRARWWLMRAAREIGQITDPVIHEWATVALDAGRAAVEAAEACDGAPRPSERLATGALEAGERARAAWLWLRWSEQSFEVALVCAALTRALHACWRATDVGGLDWWRRHDRRQYDIQPQMSSNMDGLFRIDRTRAHALVMEVP